MTATSLSVASSEKVSEDSYWTLKADICPYRFFCGSSLKHNQGEDLAYFSAATCEMLCPNINQLVSFIVSYTFLVYGHVSLDWYYLYNRVYYLRQLSSLILHAHWGGGKERFVILW